SFGGKMSHPLIDQLRFTRREWLRGLEGVSENEAMCHFGRMNCISWIVGHLAWQEQRTWLTRPQNILLFPNLNELVGHGMPMSTPSLHEMLEAWHAVTKATDPFLDTLTTERLQSDLPIDGKSSGQTIGSALRRVTYHYWYHIGEIQAVRQMLDHRDLPQYVGDIEAEAPYRPE
ncbi:MAG TPA: DinB family protein, partial [Anaerolineales bacterium]|nr:DinB family protein [Anaerolineales bacterium]